MSKEFYDKRCRYAIRKLAVGACSVMIGASFFARTVEADSVEAAGTAKNLELQDLPVNKEAESTAAVLQTAGNSALPESEDKQPSEINPVENLESGAIANAGDQVGADERASKASPGSATENAQAAETVTVTDVPKNEENNLKPKEIKFDTWEDLLNWEPGTRVDDDLNRGSVALAERYQGKVINEKANPDAKVQALSNTNSKAKDHASVGGEEFKAYAFDYWQYLDSMVFWEGLVPTPDVIDAGHRNGVPVYGTLFFNWSNTIADQERFVQALQQNEDGSFPIAKKLVDLAKYYGFDGYFINQETTGDLVEPLGKKMRDFMLYSKEYAASINHPIKYAWYDAMTYEYGRYHEDGLGDYNYQFMQKEGDQVPADQFFANFNWTKAKNDRSVEVAQWLGRDPHDVFAGLELQRGGSYRTKVDWQALLDDNGKLRLSLGLFAPDTITSLGKTGEEYHTNEDIFFTGYQGDPTGQKPADKNWYGIANLVADKTAILGDTFSSSFNTGHGRKWFVDGKIAKDGEWNYRSVSGILPTWRWWQNSSVEAEKLRAGYDFEDAYNGGNSLKFAGAVSAGTHQDVNLYSTKLVVTETSKLRVAHKGGQDSKVFLEVSTSPDYQFNNPAGKFSLTASDNWLDQEFDLSGLKGQTIYAIRLIFQQEAASKDYQFNLGQISIASSQAQPQAPTAVSVRRQVLKNAQEAEAVLTFKGSQDADYYEVYQEDEGQWQLLTGSSASTIYLPKVSRSATSQGSKQALKVVAVGKNGQRSEASLVEFDWGLEVSDTSLPKALAENIVLGATVLDSTFAAKDGGEGIEGMLNGTITSLSDKWSSELLSGSVDIRLTRPRTVVRWVMDHAGAGGESVNDGLMNTKDFDLYYKDDAGKWQLAHSVRGNIEHVTDITLDHSIKAQDWRLDVVTSDNGTPWRAIRIYNWKMYEALDTETPNIPMANVAARLLSDRAVQVGFSDVPAEATITIYDKPQDGNVLATLKAEKAGDLATGALELEQLPKLLYYRTQLPGKDISNVLAVSIPEASKTIKEVSLESGLDKTVYRQGESLNLKGARLRVRYQEEQADDLVNLSNPAVSISGYNPQELGQQKLTISYLGHSLEETVTVMSPADAGEKVARGLQIRQVPKATYLVGQNLDLTKGRFEVIYDDESKDQLSFTAEGVSVTGYDPAKVGRQSLTLHYKGLTGTFDVLVSPKAAVNDEYLKQEISAVEGSQSSLAYRFSSTEKQEALTEKLKAAKAIAENHDASQEEINQALNELKQASADLDGNQVYQASRETLESLLEKVRAVAAQDPLIRQAEDLLSSQEVTPEAFAQLKAELEKKLTAPLSSHVGSLESDETAPTVESLPELQMEVLEQAYETQVRENPMLDKGVTRLLQAGQTGTSRIYYILNAAGQRQILDREILTEVKHQILEVGTREQEQTQTSSQTEVVKAVQEALQAKPDRDEVVSRPSKPAPNPAPEKSKELPNTGDQKDQTAALAGLALLGLAGLGLMPKKKSQD